MQRIVFIVLIYLLVQACRPLERQVRQMAAAGQYHAGFYLYDPQRHKVLADYQGDKYFTPASNTKILTLYAAQHLLPDSLPAFYLTHDSLATYLWPLGYPGFLNPAVGDTLTYRVLAAADSLVLNLPATQPDRFGPGWAWDDYNSSYMPERSAFPVMGNLAAFTLDSLTGRLYVAPAWLADSVVLDSGQTFTVQRAEYANRFTVTLDSCRQDCRAQVPLRLDKATLVRLLSDTLHTPVALSALSRPDSARLYYGLPADSVYKVMMQQSDNFLAEQLLLQVAQVISDTLEAAIAIDSVSRLLDPLLPDSLIWVDGSGLSRYNMTTPRNLIALWQALVDEMGRERLLALLAAGGHAGTIAGWYAKTPPYIYGKTGTLRHNHVLSGLLHTRSGRWLYFAFMHNHYQTGGTPVKQQMERLLQLVYKKY